MSAPVNIPLPWIGADPEKVQTYLLSKGAQLVQETRWTHYDPLARHYLIGSETQTVHVFNDGKVVTNAYLFDAPDSGWQRELQSPIVTQLLFAATTAAFTAGLGPTPDPTGITGSTSTALSQENLIVFDDFTVPLDASFDTGSLFDAGSLLDTGSLFDVNTPDFSSFGDTVNFTDAATDALSSGGSIVDTSFNLDPANLVGAPGYEFDPTIFGGDVSFSDVTGDTGIAPVDVPIYTDTPAVTIADTPWGSTSVSEALGTLSNVALTAIKINAAYQAANKPAFRTSGTTASGGQVTANKNGTVTVNGRTQLIPPGTPYVTPDNTIVVNNGDGTYTTIDANGYPRTSRYPANAAAGTGSGVSNNALVIGGVLLGLGLLAARSRR